jgi:hypothetical protein
MTDPHRGSRPVGRRALLLALLAAAGCAPRPRAAGAAAPPPTVRGPAPRSDATLLEIPSWRDRSPSSAPSHSPESLLVERFPALATELHRAPLGALPTPVEHHEALGRAIGVPSLWVKHDDRIATPYGGGKIRKLELFLGEARHLGYSGVVTSGAF